MGDSINFPISGISDGDKDADQVLSSAESDNLDVIEEVLVDYTSKNRSGGLSFLDRKQVPRW